MASSDSFTNKNSLRFVKGISTTFEALKQCNMARVTGIGGILFKCRDLENTKNWYQTNLGIPTGPYGSSFEWYQEANSNKKGSTQWCPFKEETKYFEPSQKEFMINYRVDNLEELLVQLKENGVTVLDDVETFDFGKFVHILDPEGNKIELWEPID